MTANFISSEGWKFITPKEIQRRAPVWLLERKAEVATATGWDVIQALVPAPPPAAPITEVRGVDIVPNTQVL